METTKTHISASLFLEAFNENTISKVEMCCLLEPAIQKWSVNYLILENQGSKFKPNKVHRYKKLSTHDIDLWPGCPPNMHVLANIVGEEMMVEACGSSLFTKWTSSWFWHIGESRCNEKQVQASRTRVDWHDVCNLGTLRVLLPFWLSRPQMEPGHQSSWFLTVVHWSSQTPKGRRAGGRVSGAGIRGGGGNLSMGSDEDKTVLRLHYCTPLMGIPNWIFFSSFPWLASEAPNVQDWYGDDLACRSARLQ